MGKLQKTNEYGKSIIRHVANGSRRAQAGVKKIVGRLYLKSQVVCWPTHLDVPLHWPVSKRHHQGIMRTKPPFGFGERFNLAKMDRCQGNVFYGQLFTDIMKRVSECRLFTNGQAVAITMKQMFPQAGITGELELPNLEFVAGGLVLGTCPTISVRPQLPEAVRDWGARCTWATWLGTGCRPCRSPVWNVTTKSTFTLSIRSTSLRSQNCAASPRPRTSAPTMV